MSEQLERFDARLVRDACGNPDVLMKSSRDGLFIRYEDHEQQLQSVTAEYELAIRNTRAMHQKALQDNESLEAQLAASRTECEGLRKALEMVERQRCSESGYVFPVSETIAEAKRRALASSQEQPKGFPIDKTDEWEERQDRRG